MSPAGVGHRLIIETRRKARGKANSSENGISIIGLRGSGGESDPNCNDSRNACRSQNLSRRGAETDVPFRNSALAPRLDAGFVAQLLGQAMPDPARPFSGALAAYQQSPRRARLFDRRL